jgi:hypothetical protein
VTAIHIGDLVRVDDLGDPRFNFGGTGKVTAVITNEYGKTFYSVKYVDGKGKLGEWGTFDFPASRVTFVAGSVQREQDDPTMKPTNPKDAIGSDKLPLHLWPETATLTGSLAFLEGALKYGRNNWRDAGVRATIYIDAVKRHINAWAEGEDVAPDSEIPHLGHALACLAILVDAEAAGKLIDDRQYPGGYLELVEELTPHVARLKEKYADKSPRHWTIEDAS